MPTPEEVLAKFQEELRLKNNPPPSNIDSPKNDDPITSLEDLPSPPPSNVAANIEVPPTKTIKTITPLIQIPEEPRKIVVPATFANEIREILKAGGMDSMSQIQAMEKIENLLQKDK